MKKRERICSECVSYTVGEICGSHTSLYAGTENLKSSRKGIFLGRTVGVSARAGEGSYGRYQGVTLT